MIIYLYVFIFEHRYTNRMSPIIIVIILIIIIVIAMMLMRAGGATKSAGTSLYDRLGGVYGISAVVNHFSDNLVKNKVGESTNPNLVQWNQEKSGTRLPGLKFMRTLWVCDITGGPYKFHRSIDPNGADHLNLTKPHCPFKISPPEFDAVAQELANSLDAYHVPEKEKKEVLGAFAAHKHEINACS
jgi:hemoglobin